MYFVYFVQATVRAPSIYKRDARVPLALSRRPVRYIDAIGGPFGAGLIKIGFTYNVPRRVRETGLLVRSNVRFLGALRVKKHGRAAEAAIHCRFRHLRVRERTMGSIEWFRPGPDLLAFIAGLTPVAPLLLSVAHPPKRICRACGHQLPRRHRPAT